MNESLASVNHKQIGYRIKEVREQNNFSQAQLAEETELSISYISHIENAKRKASLESIIRIVNALGITVDELLAGVQLHNPTAYQTDLDLLMAEALTACIKTDGISRMTKPRCCGTLFSHIKFRFEIDYTDMLVRMVYFIFL